MYGQVTIITHVACNPPGGVVEEGTGTDEDEEPHGASNV